MVAQEWKKVERWFENQACRPDIGTDENGTGTGSDTASIIEALWNPVRSTKEADARAKTEGAQLSKGRALP